jgi:SAM-dependent methyltransferase
VPDQPACDCCPNTFSTKDAESDLKRYLQKGPDRTTRELIDAILSRDIHGATVLDVGGGIGAVQLELLAAGAARAASVDASEAYVEVARAAAEQRGFGDRTSGRVGDFVALAPEVEAADIVTMDRVLCCYRDMPALVAAAAAHARRMLGLVYPRDAWWNRVMARLIGAWGWLTRDTTRWHLHDDREIDRLLRALGFSRHQVARDLIWQVVVYERMPAVG